MTDPSPPKRSVGRPRKVRGLFDHGPPEEYVPTPPKKKGRPLGKRNALQTMKPQDARLRHTKYMRQYFGRLTDDQIKQLRPLELFSGLAFIAVKTRDHVMLREIAKDWAPYVHARMSEARPLTPEEVIRIVNTARTEAVKRGLDPDVTVGSPLGTKPN